MLALVIAYGGIVSSEVRSGTGALTLAKPISRSAFVLAKWLSQLVVIAVAGAAATAICIGVTAALLGVGPAAALAAAAGLWFAFAALLLSVMVLLSVALRAPAAASGAGVGVYISLAVLGQFELVSDVISGRPDERRRGAGARRARRLGGAAAHRRGGERPAPRRRSLALLAAGDLRLARAGAFQQAGRPSSFRLASQTVRDAQHRTTLRAARARDQCD